MPLTPLHLAPAWGVFLTARQKWSFAGLSIGSVIPDAEIPILYATGLEMQTGHGIMHSLLGALTFDAVLAVLAVYLLYPALAGFWEGRFGTRWVHFGGVDVGDVDKLHRVIAGVYLGVVLHISVDFLTHSSMPYLWPYAGPVSTFSFAGNFWWTILVNIMLLIAILFLMRLHLGRMEDTAPEK